MLSAAAHSVPHIRDGLTCGFHFTEVRGRRSLLLPTHVKNGCSEMSLCADGKYTEAARRKRVASTNA